MTLLAIFGCDPHARDLPATLEGLGIEAEVQQTSERHGAGGDGYTTHHVHALLRDRDERLLEREDLAITMNGAVLPTRGEHGHYYDRHPFYRLDDAGGLIAPDTDCVFAVRRPDCTYHEAGVVRTPRALRAAQFEFPATASRRDPLAVAWTGLAEPAELIVFRSVSYTDSGGNTVLESGCANDLEALRRTIGPGMFRRASGRLEIPASFLADRAGRRVSEVGLEISVIHEGAVFDPFSRNSRLRAVRRLILRAELID